MKVILDHKEGLMLLCSQSKSTCSNKPVYTYIWPVDDLTIPAHISFRLHLDKLTNYNDTKLSEPEPFLDIRTSTVVILCSYWLHTFKLQQRTWTAQRGNIEVVKGCSGSLIWLIISGCLSVLSSSPIKDSSRFLDQETLASVLVVSKKKFQSWFTKTDLLMFHNQT